MVQVPSGKHTNNDGKSPCWMGKSTMSMVIFNSYFDITRGYLLDRLGTCWCSKRRTLRPSDCHVASTKMCRMIAWDRIHLGSWDWTTPVDPIGFGLPQTVYLKNAAKRNHQGLFGVPLKIFGQKPNPQLRPSSLKASKILALRSRQKRIQVVNAMPSSFTKLK
jgi:hypothetical protein